MSVSQTDIAFENKKIRWVTIGFSLLSLYRALSIATGQFLYNGYSLTTEEWIYLIFVVTLMILLMSQKQVTAAAFLTAIFYPKFETTLGSGNISTPIFIHFCYVLGLWNWIFKKYSLEKPENSDRARLAINQLLWMFFAGFAIVNLLSALLHFADPYWRSGSGMEIVLQTHYWGKQFTFFRNLRHNYPEIMDIIMPLENYITLFSQFLILPLYIWKLGRKIVLIWFIAYLIHIVFFLRIVWMPHFTILLAMLIFCRKIPNIYGINLIKPSNEFKELRIFMWIGYVFFLLLFLLRTPGISNYTDKVFWMLREWDTRVWFNRRINQMGLGQPNILNAEHIESPRRFILYHREGNVKTMLPIMGKAGERQNYLPDPFRIENQGLENIYGNTWCHVVSADSFTYMNSPTPYKWKGRAVERLIRIDYFVKGRKGKHEYEVEFWERKKPHENGVPSWDYSDTLMEIRQYTFNGENEPIRVSSLRK
jgi:hypothetical protein